MKKIKKLPKPPSLETLVDDHTREAHSLLLANGGRGLRSGIYGAMIAALHWSRDVEKYEANQKLIEKKKPKRKKIFREVGFP